MAAPSQLALRYGTYYGLSCGTSDGWGGRSRVGVVVEEKKQGCRRQCAHTPRLMSTPGGTGPKEASVEGGGLTDRSLGPLNALNLRHRT